MARWPAAPEGKRAALEPRAAGAAATQRRANGHLAKVQIDFYVAAAVATHDGVPTRRRTASPLPGQPSTMTSSLPLSFTPPSPLLHHSTSPLCFATLLTVPRLCLSSRIPRFFLFRLIHTPLFFPRLTSSAFVTLLFSTNIRISVYSFVWFHRRFSSSTLTVCSLAARMRASRDMPREPFASPLLPCDWI